MALAGLNMKGLVSPLPGQVILTLYMPKYKNLPAQAMEQLFQGPCIFNSSMATNTFQSYICPQHITFYVPHPEIYLGEYISKARIQNNKNLFFKSHLNPPPLENVLTRAGSVK